MASFFELANTCIEVKSTSTKTDDKPLQQSLLLVMLCSALSIYIAFTVTFVLVSILITVFHFFHFFYIVVCSCAQALDNSIMIFPAMQCCTGTVVGLLYCNVTSVGYSTLDRKEACIGLYNSQRFLLA